MSSEPGTGCHDGERGAVAAEHLGVVIVVAALVAALLGVVPGLARGLVSAMTEAVCALTGGGCGVAVTLAADEEFTPPPLPDAPPPPPTDPGAGEHGPEGAGVGDRLAEQAWYRAADLAEARGWTDAARHMRHYLDNSGETLTVDPARMLGDLGPIGDVVAGTLDAEVAAALDSLRDGYDGTPAATTLESGWRGAYATSEMSSNWFYAMGGFQYAVGGRVVVEPPDSGGGPPTVSVEYRVHVTDRYNWDAEKSTGIGPLTVTDEDMADLHRAGLAQEYDIRGSSEVVSVEAPFYGEVSVGDSLPEADGRDGGRSDPGRDRGR